MGECEKCGKVKTIHPWREEIGMRYCEKCANDDNAKRSETHNKTVRILQRTDTIRCATCKHGKANEASYTGWECKASAIVCRPIHQGVLYEQR
jgi:hypothetical protein